MLRFYAALLPAVSRADNLAAVTSWAVGLGYGISLLALILLSALVPTGEQAQRVFVPFAFLYLLLTLPAITFAPDFPSREANEPFLKAYGSLRETFRQARQLRGLFRFLIAFLLAFAVAHAEEKLIDDYRLLLAVKAPSPNARFHRLSLEKEPTVGPHH